MTEDANAVAVQTGLLARFPQRSGARSCIVGFQGPARECRLPSMGAQILGPLHQQQIRTVTEQQQHRCCPTLAMFRWIPRDVVDMHAARTLGHRH